MTPSVSIILLSALRRNCTERCIASIDRTAGPDVEIVVVDMGGDAGLRTWLETEGRRRKNMKVIFNDRNVGTTRGRNQGIAVASGKEIFFLDNDAELTDGWEKRLTDMRHRYGPDAIFGAKLVRSDGGVYFCSQNVVDEMGPAGRRVGLRMVRPLRITDPAANIEGVVPWYPTGALIAPRDIIAKVGGFDEHLWSVEEDKDICFRARELGARIVYDPGITVIHDRVRDAHYDTTIRFGDIPRIRADIDYFEKRWTCKVELVYSEECLKTSGFSDEAIKQMLSGPLGSIFTILRGAEGDAA